MAVKEKLVTIKGRHINGDCRIGSGVLYHEVAVFTLIQFLHTFKESFSGILRCNSWNESKQCITEVFCHFSNLDVMLIGTPDTAVINIPAASCIVHQDNAAEEIHKHSAIADLEGFIARICMR